MRKGWNACMHSECWSGHGNQGSGVLQRSARGVQKLPGSRVTGNHTPQAQIAQPTMQGATLVRTVPQAPLLPTLGQMLKPPRPQLCTALGQKQGAEKSVAFPGATAVGC